MSKRRVHVKAEHDDAAHGSSANGTERVETVHHDGGGHPCAGAEPAAPDHGEIAGLGGVLSRLLYTASYTVSYGVVFPVMFVVYSVPAENALVRGLLEGGRAARDAVAALYDDGGHADSSDSAPAAELGPA